MRRLKKMLALGGNVTKKSLHQLGDEGILDFRVTFCAFSVENSYAHKQSKFYVFLFMRSGI